MQPSLPSGGPRILRCPHCGAPLEAQPQALFARCAYCGHNVQLGAPSVPQPAPATVPATGSLPRGAILLVAAAVVVLGAVAAFALLGAGSSSPAATPALATPQVQAALPVRETAAQPRATTAERSPPASKSPGETRFPLRSLLGIDVTIDIDRSRDHLLGLFPSAGSERVADQLRFEVPLDSPWFDHTVLSWKNEKAGKLTTVSFNPPHGDSKFKNQQEIADCLTKGLGKPEVREIDHLAGELSYFWGKGFPKAWANLYSGYLWLSFENPKGIAPVTLPQVVRTLDGCVQPSH